VSKKKALTLIAVSFLWISSTEAQESGDVEVAIQQPTYNPTGKRDPFKPFIKLTEKEKELKPQADELLPPLRRYSLNEFKLVGIVWAGQQPKAVIVDPEKNTYVLGVADEIGNRQGKIIEIRNNGILVAEKRHLEDIFGEKKIETEMSVLAFKE
jgi:Tfp pilus assembly protein PilP